MGHTTVSCRGIFENQDEEIGLACASYGDGLEFVRCGCETYVFGDQGEGASSSAVVYACILKYAFTELRRQKV